jgi:hypothetical protein
MNENEYLIIIKFDDQLYKINKQLKIMEQETSMQRAPEIKSNMQIKVFINI